jgi:hypothetical protein
MRWIAVLLIVYLLPVLVQPADGHSHLWSLALADDDDDDGDDDGDDDDGDDDGGDDDDGDDDQGGGAGRAGDGGQDPLGFLNSIFGGDDDQDDDRGNVEDEIVGVGLDSLDVAALELVGFRLTEELELRALGLSVVRLDVPVGIGTREGLALARATRPGAVFDLNHLYRSNAAAGCGTERCWGGRLIGLETQSLASCTEGGRIAIVDTAVDTRHDALRDSFVVQRSFRPSGAEAVPPAHGTAIAALLVGQAPRDAPALVPRARLFAAEVFYLRGGEARTDSLALLRGIDWAVESQAQVIALSLSGGANAALERAVRQAARRAALVAAAGNDGPEGAPAYPAAYPEVMAVTAVDARKRPYRFANRGSYIDLAAPGVDVWSAGADGGFQTWTGTSFAVPFAAAALLHAAGLSGGDAARARSLLVESAEDLGALGRDDVFGWGLLRAPQGAC